MTPAFILRACVCWFWGFVIISSRKFVLPWYVLGQEDRRAGGGFDELIVVF